MRPICNNGGAGTGTIPFMRGRPARETIIGDDDISNLKIALATTKTLEEFFALV
jgi:hypothetical protein